MPYKLEDYFYYTRYEDGKEYPIYCRKKGSLEAEEQISKLSTVRIQLISDEPELDHDQIINQRVNIGIKQCDGASERHFNGFVSDFWQAEPEDHYYIYHATVVPWPWFLTLTQDCRIYQDKTVPQVIQDVFA